MTKEDSNIDLTAPGESSRPDSTEIQNRKDRFVETHKVTTLKIAAPVQKPVRVKDFGRHQYDLDMVEIARLDQIADRAIRKDKKFQTHLALKFQSFVDRKANYASYLDKHQIVKGAKDRDAVPAKIGKVSVEVSIWINQSIRVNCCGPQGGIVPTDIRLIGILWMLL
jgi:hypothetical protein